MTSITVVSDGKIIKNEDPIYQPDIFSLNYAVTAFEGLRSYTEQSRNFIFRLEEHVERLLKSAEHLGFDIKKYSKEYIKNEIINCVKVNRNMELYIRPIFFYESGIMNLKVPPKTNFSVFTFEHKRKEAPDIISLEISKHRREINSINKKISKNYYDSFIALKDKKSEFDDVLLLSNDDYITETSAHNVFFITSENKVITPSVDYCLEGITRNTAIYFLRKNNIEVNEIAIKVDELKSNIVAAFTTSTASEIRIIEKIDSTLLNVKHPVTAKLVSDFHSYLIGSFEMNQKETGWKTYV